VSTRPKADVDRDVDATSPIVVADMFRSLDEMGQDGTPDAGAQDSFTRSGLHTFGTSVSIVVFGFATSVVVARAAGPAGKGGYDLSLASASLLVAVLGFALPSGVSYVIARGIGSARWLFSRLGWFAVAQGAAAFLLLLLVAQTPISSALLASGTGTDLALPIAVLVTLTLLTGHLRAILVGRQLFIASNTREIAVRGATLVTMSCVVVASYSLARPVSAIVLVWTAVGMAVLSCFIYLPTLPPRRPETRTVTGLREVVAFSMPAYGAQLAQFLNYRLDLFLVGLLLSVQQVGLYALAVSLAQLLWLISNAAAVVLFPRVAAGTGRHAFGPEAARVSRLVLVATLFAASALALVSPVVIPALYGAEFAPSVVPLLWLLPGVVAFSIANVLGSFVTGIGRPGLILATSVLGLVVTVPMDLILIPVMGITGAAIASTASYSVSALAMLVVFARYSGVGLASAVFVRSSDLAFIRGLILRRWHGR
jgi:O-antigen/teichoic acid export membrane protein